MSTCKVGHNENDELHQVEGDAEQAALLLQKSLRGRAVQVFSSLSAAQHIGSSVLSTAASFMRHIRLLDLPSRLPCHVFWMLHVIVD